MSELLTSVSEISQTNRLIISPKYSGHSQSSLEELFVETDSGQYIQKNVVIDKANQVDLTATAARIGAVITTTTGPVHGLMGVHDGKWDIALNIDLDIAGQQYVFGHELGHIALIMHFLAWGSSEIPAYLDRVDQEPDFYRYTEAFCDYFSGRVLDAVYPSTLPRRAVPRRPAPVEQLRLVME